MSARESSKPPPSALPLRAEQCEHSGRRQCRPLPNRAHPLGSLQYWGHSISIVELDCDPASIADIFKEDVSYRAQARRFLWEFFD